MPKEPHYYFDIVQQTPEWYAAKLGMFSSSAFHIFLGDSKTKEEKLWELVAERRYQDSDTEEFQSYYTDRGNILEHEARRVYQVVNEVEVQQVGLVEDCEYFPGWVVCSPDGLVGDDGIIEIKCLVAKNMLQYTEGKYADDYYVSPQYKTQVQFNLMVTQRKWCDFIYYHPRIGIRIKRIERDEEYIQKIKDALTECIKYIEERL